MPVTERIFKGGNFLCSSGIIPSEIGIIPSCALNAAITS